MVDDEPFNVQAVANILQMLGINKERQIIVGRNGQDTIDIIMRAIEEDEIEQIGLIISDCSMPVVDGYVSVKEIRRLLSQHRPNDPPLCIVALTGHVEPEYVQKAMDHGFNKVMPKPVNVRDLAQILLQERLISEIPAFALR